MKRTLIACVAAGSLLVPATASAHDGGSVDHQNKHLRTKARTVTGDWMAPGRNIVVDGMSNGKKATDAQVDDYLDTLRRMAYPPAPEPVVEAPPATAAPAAVASQAPAVAQAAPAAPAPASTGSGSYALPKSIVMCESGGNYKAVNPNNPNRPAGAYQMITSTWLAWGGGKYAPTADQATPAQQDEIAANGWDGGAGAGHWECKG